MPLAGFTMRDKNGVGRFGRLIREDEAAEMDVFLTPHGELVRVVAVLIDGRPALEQVPLDYSYSVKVPSG